MPASGILDPHLLLHLLRNRTWLIGTLATVAGVGLQVLALGFGPLLLVQPLLVTALLFTTVFLARTYRRRLDRLVLAGALLCVGGLSLFLLVAHPAQHNDQLLGGGHLLPLAITFTLVVMLCLGFAYRSHHATRVLGLAVATGVRYGVTAGLMKIVSGQLRSGAAVPFSHWVLYVVCLIGPIGFLLSQNTFQQGTLLAPAVAVITTVDPLVGVGIGISWFGETVRTGPASLAGELIAALAVIGGIMVLSHRSESLKKHVTAPAARRARPHSRPVMP